MVEKITKWRMRILGLYKSDYREGFHVRKMAKLLGANHVTLLPHLKALEKEKILVPKEVGRSKVYFLNPNNIIGKEYLIISEKFAASEFFEKTFLIKKIYDGIFGLNLKDSIILFGSYAKGTATEESDIDLLLIGEASGNDIRKIKEVGKMYGKEANVKSASIENFESGIKHDVLIGEVVKHHIVLQNPDVFVNALWRYFGEK